MNTLKLKLKSLFPDIDFHRQCILRQDAQGNIFISEWNRPEPQPADAALAAIQDQTAIDAALGRRADFDNSSEIVKALALAVLDELNQLRTAAGLQPRTAAQLKTAIRGKL